MAEVFEAKWARQVSKKALRFLTILPIAIFIWFIGWSLYWIGQQKERKKK